MREYPRAYDGGMMRFRSNPRGRRAAAATAAGALAVLASGCALGVGVAIPVGPFGAVHVGADSNGTVGGGVSVGRGGVSVGVGGATRLPARPASAPSSSPQDDPPPTHGR